MSRKESEAFDVSKLRNGAIKCFEVVRPDGYHESHYFYRDHDGELFQVVTRNWNTGNKLQHAWQTAKKSRA